MTNIPALIERVRRSSRPGRAFADLVEAGPSALRDVIATAKESDTDESELRRVIELNTSRAAVPILIEGMGSGRPAVTRSIALALLGSRDPKARALVLGRLTDPGESGSTRAAVAEVLPGRVGAAERRALRRVLAEPPDPDEEYPLLVTAAATALATSGDHSGAEALRPLLTSPHESARALAVSTLKIVTGPEAFTWLTRAAADPSIEVRYAAVDPLFLLGAPACVEALLPLAVDEYEGIRARSRARLAHLLALVIDDDDSDDDLDFIHEQWDLTRAGMAGRTCHRYAVPIDLNDLLDDFADRTNVRPAMVEELQILTGVDVPAIYKKSGVRAVPKALAHVDFTIGAVHKWGHRRPMPRLPG
jgi:HEAT repeat protein